MLLSVRSHVSPCCTQCHSNCRDEGRTFVPQLRLNTSTWMDAVPHQHLAVCSLCLERSPAVPGSSWFIDRCAPPDTDHDLVALPLPYLHKQKWFFEMLQTSDDTSIINNACPPASLIKCQTNFRSLETQKANRNWHWSLDPNDTARPAGLTAPARLQRCNAGVFLGQNVAL